MNSQDVFQAKQIKEFTEKRLSKERKIFMYSDLVKNIFGLALSDFLFDDGRFDLKYFLFAVRFLNSPLSISDFLRINFGPQGLRIVQQLLL